MATEYKQLKFRRGTAVDWQANPVLAEGEPGVDLTARRMKVGDGQNAWSALPWVTMDAAEVARLEAAATALDAAADPYDAATATVLALPNGVARQELQRTIDAALATSGAGADRFTADAWTPGSAVRPLTADRSRMVNLGSSTPNMITPFIQTAVNSAGWGITCVSGAQPGERFQHTLARLGILNAILTFPNNTIPASGAVTVTTNLPNQNLMKTYTGNIVVGGQSVMGTLALTGGGGTFTFTRATAGTAITLSGPVEFLPALRDAANNPQAAFYRDTIALIATGKNNFGTAGVAEAVNAANDLVLEWLIAQRKYVILMGEFANRNANATEKANVAAVNAHRKRVAETNPYVQYVDVQAYLIGSQVWTDTGITPTSTDLSQQAQGVKPTSLSLDDAHMNDAALKAVTDQRIMPALGLLLNLPYTPPNPPDTTTGLLAKWETDALTLGSLPSWAPTAGSRSDMTLTESTTSKQPVVVESTISGVAKKVLRFAAASAQMIRSAVFADAASDVQMPATEVMFINPTTGASMNIFNGSGVSGRSGYLHTQLNASGVVQIGGGAVAELSGTTGLTSGAWVVVASVFDGANSRIYVNGTLQASGAVGVAQAATARLPRVTIGANSGGNTSYYNGDIAKIALYSRALTASDIQALTQEWRTALGV